MKGDWRKLRSLSRAEWLVLAQCAALFPLVRLAQRWTRLDELNARLVRWFGGSAPVPYRRRRQVPAEEITRLVRIAALRGLVRPNCLQHALVLRTLLLRHGFDAAIRFGVRKNDGALEAHAWVELGGRVLDDPPDIGRQYAPFQRPVISDRGRIR